MTTIITSGADTIYPTIVDGYESSRSARNIVHPILGRATPDVSLRPAQLRTGTLTLVFGDTTETSELVVIDGIVQPLTTPAQNAEEASLIAVDLHATGGVFSLSDTDRPSILMSYVVRPGDIRRDLDEQTREVWIVSIPFQEVTP